MSSTNNGANQSTCSTEMQFGLCMMDCASDDECASGICDPLWNICVPRDETCPEDTDDGTDTYDNDTEVDSGTPDAGNSTATGGCVCNSAGAGAAPRRLARILSKLF